MNRIRNSLIEYTRDCVDRVDGRLHERSEALWHSRVYQRWGIVPSLDLDARDVVIAGYPKSGNTWFQNLIAGLVYAMDPRYATDSMVQHLVPDLDIYPFYRRYGTPTYFKSHRFPEPSFRRVIYLLRDGRDVMVSYYHYLVAHYGPSFNFELLVREGDDKGHQWHQHVEAWLANPYDAELLIIKYEDLLSSGLRELQRCRDFLGLEDDDAALVSVFERASFQNMRKKEEWDRWDHRQWWPKDRYFVRRGQAGSYKDEMSDEILQAFLETAGATLRRCGYLSEEPAPVSAW